jgi:small-conductance mechanosensitive channel
MSSFQDPDYQQRQSAAAVAKQARLQKFRPASEDPEVARRHAARVAMNEARLVRIAEREAAERAHEAELAEQAAQAQREAEEAEALLVAQAANGRFCWRPSKKPPRMPGMRPAKRQKKERR